MGSGYCHPCAHKHYLRLVDETPITPELLKRYQQRFACTFDNGSVVENCSWWYLISTLQIPPRTLGELRQLANRLNIPLNESEK